MLLRLLACAVLLLSGCSTMRPHSTVSDTTRLTHWQAEGKMGLRVTDRGGNLFFVWTQQGPRYELTLSGPLGAGKTTLAGGPDGVVLRNGELGDIAASSPEVLLEAVTGFSAPVSHLAHWLKAQPATLDARIERDSKGRIQRIDEDGWTATFPTWDDRHPALPRKIMVTGPDTRLTIVVSHWQPDLDNATPAALTITPAP